MTVSPLRHLGALAIYCFWIALVSGVYLFIFYETSLAGAWASVERLTQDQWFAGGVMRSLHRYASAAAVLLIVVHVIVEILKGHYKGPRWFSWVTGVPLVWIVVVFGISGYWMVWDELAQYIAVSTARLFDSLPVFTDPMSRNFLTNESVSDRFFTLIAFIHLVGLPIILVLGLWFHLLRVRLPRINPPRVQMAMCLGLLTVLSFVEPAVSHGVADLARVPTEMRIDWFYLAVYPLLSETSAGFTWAVVVGGTFLLAALPWLPPRKAPSVAQVHLADCTGCGYCADDCPYGAIDMVQRTDGRNFEMEAQVAADLCVGCGICTGSCPSSSLFRRVEPLTTGIEMPIFTIDRLKTLILDGRRGRRGGSLVVGCEHGVEVGTGLGKDDRAIVLPCIGMLPPAAIDYALKVGGYGGIVVAGCAQDGCYHRFGDIWTIDRIARRRPPMLRERVPRERLRLLWGRKP